MITKITRKAIRPMRKILKSKFIFNIHLILSIVFFIPLLAIALSGAIVSYQNEIANFINKDLLKVEYNGSKPLEISEILAKFKSQTGVGTPVRIFIPNDENSSIKIYASRMNSYYVNPYTGDILGKDVGEKIIRTVLMVHRNLALSLTKDKGLEILGKNIVGITTIAFLVLIISGIWLYAPKIKHNFSHNLRPNFRLKGFAFFYNIHSVFGIWLSAILIVICFTGLYYSYALVKDAVNATFGVEVKKGEKPSENKTKQDFDFKKIQNGYEIFKEQKDNKFEHMTIILPDTNGIFRVIYSDGSFRSIEAQVDLNEGKIKDGDSISLSRKISKTIYDLHTGYFFGRFGQILWSTVSFFVLVFVITGFFMTTKRIFKKNCRSK